jgi:hypothetical protein
MYRGAQSEALSKGRPILARRGLTELYGDHYGDHSMHSHLVYRPRRSHFCIEFLGVEFPIVVSRAVIRPIGRPAPRPGTSWCARLPWPCSSSSVGAVEASGAVGSPGNNLKVPWDGVGRRWASGDLMTKVVDVSPCGSQTSLGGMSATNRSPSSSSRVTRVLSRLATASRSRDLSSFRAISALVRPRASALP